jgi:2-polyprenyl-6-methoxyphenol hydroxylase-like FAD-dependent oxidoreductase
MANVLVLGGGLGGLAAALFAARHGHLVTVLERDHPPADGTADEDFTGWQRGGAPQIRQGHVFLARSTEVLAAEAPDVLAAILRRGAVAVPLSPDDDAANVLSRRLVYEAEFRRIVEREPGVEVRSGTTVRGLRFGRGTDGVPAVHGVRTDEGDLESDLVVDATGRASRTPRRLAGGGVTMPAESVQACGFFYLTRHYRLRTGSSFPTTRVPIVAPLDYLTVLAFPGDNGCFQLSVAVAAEDPCRRQLRDPEAFDRFLAAVPLSAPWIERGEPLDEPHPMARIENRWRRLVTDGRPVVAGLVLLGDAAMQTNPTTGRGVSAAFAQAQELARLLDEDRGSVRLPVDLDIWTARQLGVWFDSQRDIDGVRVRQLQAGLRNERTPPPDDPTNRFIAAMAVLGQDDPVIQKASMRAYNLLIPPDEIMADRVVARRVVGYLRRHPVLDVRPQTGPDRPAFERLVGVAKARSRT